MTIADEARDNAINCEMVKYAYRQSKDGVVVSFVVHPNDVPAALSVAPLGARYIVALVQIGDDEKPISRKEAMPNPSQSLEPRLHNAQPQPEQDKPQAGAKRKWHELDLSTAAAMRCNEPTFRAYLNEECGFDTENQDDAAIVVRQLCRVESRSELNTSPEAALRWQALDEQYTAWKVLEHG